MQNYRINDSEILSTVAGSPDAFENNGESGLERPIEFRAARFISINRRQLCLSTNLISGLSTKIFYVERDEFPRRTMVPFLFFSLFLSPPSQQEAQSRAAESGRAAFVVQSATTEKGAR